MIKSIEELEKYVEIDSHNLEQELFKQSQIYYEVGKEWAEACHKRDQSKQALEQAYASISSNFRKDNTAKITESIVKEFTESNPVYVDFYRKHIDYTHKSKELEVLKNALEQKLDSIKELIRLLTMGYYGLGLTDSKINEYKELRNQSLNKETK